MSVEESISKLISEYEMEETIMVLQQEDMNNLVDILKEAKMKIAELEMANDVLTDFKSQLSSKLQTYEEMETKWSQIVNCESKLEAKNESLKIQLNEAKEKIDSLTIEIAELNLKLVQSENSAIQERDSRMNSERERKDLFAKNMELQSEMMSFNKLLRDNQNNTPHLEVQNVLLKTQLKDLEEKLAEMKLEKQAEEINDSKSTIRAEQLKRMKVQLMELLDEREELLNNLREAFMKNQTLSEQKDQLEVKIKKLEEDKSANLIAKNLQLRLQEVSSQLEKITHERDETKAKLDELEQEHTSRILLTIEQKNKKEEIDSIIYAKDLEIEELTSENEVLRTRIADLTEKNEELVNDASKDLIIEELSVELDRLAQEKTYVENEFASWKAIFELEGSESLFRSTQPTTVVPSNCVYCQMDPADHGFSPCNHVCVCALCKDAVRENQQKCPICDVTFTGIFRRV